MQCSRTTCVDERFVLEVHRRDGLESESAKKNCSITNSLQTAAAFAGLTGIYSPM